MIIWGIIAFLFYRGMKDGGNTLPLTKSFFAGFIATLVWSGIRAVGTLIGYGGEVNVLNIIIFGLMAALTILLGYLYDTGKIKKAVLIVFIAIVFIAYCFIIIYGVNINYSGGKSIETKTEETETETKTEPVYATLSDVSIEITDTSWKQITSPSGLTLYDINENGDPTPYTEDEKEIAYDNITYGEEYCDSEILYQESSPANIFDLAKIESENRAYNTIDDFIASSDKGIVMKDKHFDIDGVHAYTYYYKSSDTDEYDDADSSETVFVYNDDFYTLHVSAFYINDIEPLTKRLVSRITLN